MGWGKNKKGTGEKKHKYNASKITVDGIVFDSKLESYMHGRLEQVRIPFEFQFEIELTPKFRTADDKAVRRMYMKVDFVIRKNGRTYFADTKGFATPDAKIKYKLLQHLIYRTDRNAVVLFCKNKGEVDAFINKILN